MKNLILTSVDRPTPIKVTFESVQKKAEWYGLRVVTFVLLPIFILESDEGVYYTGDSLEGLDSYLNTLE